MPEKKLGTSRISLRSALNTANFVWPEFVSVHGLVVRAQDFKVNPCPASTTLTDWEAFVNHTHILDEFANKEGVIEKHQRSGLQGEWEVRYIETHPDFVSACELGIIAAKLWALKLSHTLTFIAGWQTTATSSMSPLQAFRPV